MTLCEFDWRSEVGGCVASLGTLLVKSLELQVGDSWIQTRKWEIIQDPYSNWTLGADGGLRMKGRLVVLDVPQLKTELFDEAHRTRHTAHSGTTKMYKDLKRNFL